MTSETETCVRCDSVPCRCSECEFCGAMYYDIPCNCCDQCGNAPCTCCSECECAECECSKFGSSEIPPWEQRGIVVSALNTTGDWNKIWEINNGEIDPIQVASDFYILEAIAAGVFYPPKEKIVTPVDSNEFFDTFQLDPTTAKSKKLLKLREEIMDKTPLIKLGALQAQAEKELENLVDKHVLDFRNYAHMVIAGEARYHMAIGGRVLHRERSTAWAGWADVFEKVGELAIADLADLFLEFEDDGYGGPSWAACAEVLYLYESKQLGPNDSMNKRMFLDRVWTLEHNNGSFLNKLKWRVHTKPKTSLNGMRVILDAHASDPPNYPILLAHNSKPVKELVDEWSQTLSDTGRTVRITTDFDKPLKVCKWCLHHDGHVWSCRFRYSHVAASDFDEISAFHDITKWSNAQKPSSLDVNGELNENNILSMAITISKWSSSGKYISTTEEMSWGEFTQYDKKTPAGSEIVIRFGLGHEDDREAFAFTNIGTDVGTPYSYMLKMMEKI